jgi:hypothetical protein
MRVFCIIIVWFEVPCLSTFCYQGYVCNGYCKDLDDEIVPPHTRSLALFAEKAFSVLPQ